MLESLGFGREKKPDWRKMVREIDKRRVEREELDAMLHHHDRKDLDLIEELSSPLDKYPRCYKCPGHIIPPKNPIVYLGHFYHFECFISSDQALGEMIIINHRDDKS